MVTLEEQFYETAANEIANNKPAMAIWGKAFSLSAGDEQKAKALYISLRVDQLEREYRHTQQELTSEAWNEITSEKLFTCPFCQGRAIARAKETDVLVRIFSNCDAFHYSCRLCGHELHHREENSKTPTLTQLPESQKHAGGMVVTGFVFGVLSLPLFFTVLVPVLAIIFSSIGLATFRPEAQNHKWMAGVGLALGMFLTLTSLAMRFQ